MAGKCSPFLIIRKTLSFVEKKNMTSTVKIQIPNSISLSLSLSLSLSQISYRIIEAYLSSFSR